MFLLLSQRLVASYLEPRDIRRYIRRVIHNPQFVRPYKENQCVDVVRELALTVGKNRQDRKLRSVGPEKMRSHVLAGRETHPLDVHMP